MPASARASALVAALMLAVPASAPQAQGARIDLVNRSVLRICSDPANLPFSNEAREGFENKIAEIVADELKLPLSYIWFPQATGFVRQTLFAKQCDVILGFPQGDDLVLNTNAYYRSIYALVTVPGRGLDGVGELGDPRLQGRRLGVIAGTPPSNIMVRLGLMANARPYRLMVDRRAESPAEEMIADLRSGAIDAAVLWGPMAGYFARRGGDPLTVTPLLKEAGAPRLAYRIGFGIRPQEDDWKHTLNDVIAKRRGDIERVLIDYGVPLIDEQSNLITAPHP